MRKKVSLPGFYNLVMGVGYISTTRWSFHTTGLDSTEKQKSPQLTEANMLRPLDINKGREGKKKTNYSRLLFQSPSPVNTKHHFTNYSLLTCPFIQISVPSKTAM